MAMHRITTHDSRSNTCIGRVFDAIDKVTNCCHHANVHAVTVSVPVDQEPRPTERRGLSNQ